MGFTSNRFPSNQNYSQLEPLITVKQLRETYLFGVNATDENGNELSDDALQRFVDNAVSILEHDLDLAIMPRQKEEHKDYFANDYYEWGYMQLNNYPVIDLQPIPGVTVSGLRMVYLRDNVTMETAFDIPPEWIRLDKDSGMIRLIPNNRFPGNLQVSGSGTFFPELFHRQSFVPNLWVVNYTHGFCQGGIPSILNMTIGLLAANLFLIVAGDLILGSPGIAGSSLTLDGLSQSIQTTASAENNGYSARIKDNNRNLFGDKVLGTTGSIEILRRYYKGAPMAII